MGARAAVRCKAERGERCRLDRLWRALKGCKRRRGMRAAAQQTAPVQQLRFPPAPRLAAAGVAGAGGRGACDPSAPRAIDADSEHPRGLTSSQVQQGRPRPLCQPALQSHSSCHRSQGATGNAADYKAAAAACACRQSGESSSDNPIAALREAQTADGACSAHSTSPATSKCQETEADFRLSSLHSARSEKGARGQRTVH